ncbi:MAG: hypothetical protein LBQ30_00540 [Treponema sp.]|jgi:antitoxin component YwqK of YwqJK toxin-antitoxin module|nr:hypothetical protein [Treponema sp.]
MKKDDVYNNGQKVSEMAGEILTYYYKSGKIKARGNCINEKFEGKWIFYKENGVVWQEGNFKNNKKEGEWKRYSENGELEYHVAFKDGKQIHKHT